MSIFARGSVMDRKVIYENCFPLSRHVRERRVIREVHKAQRLVTR